MMLLVTSLQIATRVFKHKTLGDILIPLLDMANHLEVRKCLLLDLPCDSSTCSGCV